MTMKTFDTAYTTYDNNPDQPINWHDGSLVNKTGNTVIHFGDVKTWTRDVTWSVSPNAKLHEWHSCNIGGNNGKSHEANFEQNVSGWGRYIPMEFIRGFSIDFQQDSTGGHGVYLLNAGIEFINNSGTTYRWGSYDRSRQSDTNRHIAAYVFSNADRAEMSKNGARFHRFICRLSTSGGTGTRDTRVKLGDFRLFYGDTGCDHGRWVLPNLRRLSDSDNPDILPM